MLKHENFEITSAANVPLSAAENRIFFSHFLVGNVAASHLLMARIFLLLSRIFDNTYGDCINSGRSLEWLSNRFLHVLRAAYHSAFNCLWILLISPLVYGASYSSTYMSNISCTYSKRAICMLKWPFRWCIFHDHDLVFFPLWRRSFDDFGFLHFCLKNNEL